MNPYRESGERDVQSELVDEPHDDYVDALPIGMCAAFECPWCGHLRLWGKHCLGCALAGMVDSDTAIV